MIPKYLENKIVNEIDEDKRYRSIYKWKRIGWLFFAIGVSIHKNYEVISMNNEEFKCRSCGEKYKHDFCATKDISICRWCSGEEEEVI